MVESLFLISLIAFYRLSSSLLLLFSGILISVTKSSYSSPDLLFLNTSDLSNPLVVLTIFVIFLMALALDSKTCRFLSLIMAVSLAFVFFADSVLLFYISFETSMLPVLVLILSLGAQPERLAASLYMLFYTVVASLPFLVLIISGQVLTFSGQFVNFSGLMTSVLFIPFLVKAPLYLLHLWLPRAHVEAPAIGSMMLAAVMLKISGYGLWRLSFSFSLVASSSLASYSCIAGGVCSLVALSQVDVKSLIAYSSIVHMSLVIFVLVVCAETSFSSALMMMLAHGVCSSGLFYQGTLLYQRFNTRSLLVCQGLLSICPALALTWAFLVLMNASAPPSLSLVSEVMMFQTSLGLSYLTVIGISLSVISVLIYSLILYYCYFHGVGVWQGPGPAASVSALAISFYHSVWWVTGPLLVVSLSWQ